MFVETIPGRPDEGSLALIERLTSGRVVGWYRAGGALMVRELSAEQLRLLEDLEAAAPGNVERVRIVD